MRVHAHACVYMCGCDGGQYLGLASVPKIPFASGPIWQAPTQVQMEQKKLYVGSQDTHNLRLGLSEGYEGCHGSSVHLCLAFLPVN